MSMDPLSIGVTFPRLAKAKTTWSMLIYPIEKIQPFTLIHKEPAPNNIPRISILIETHPVKGAQHAHVLLRELEFLVRHTRRVEADERWPLEAERRTTE